MAWLGLLVEEKLWYNVQTLFMKLFFCLISKNVSIKNYSPLTRQGELSEADIAQYGALLGLSLHPSGQTHPSLKP